MPTDTFSGVRLATQADEGPIFDLLVMLYEENALFQMASAKVRATIEHATRGKGGLIGLIDGKTGPEGSVGMAIEQFWYSDQSVLVEHWNFVHPKHRKTTHAKRLIEFAKWCSDRLELPLVMGIMSSVRTEAKVRLYRRQMPLLGAFFGHGLPVGIMQHSKAA